MSGYAGPEIANDGLVLCLDAGNVKSYPGSGTTWTDLSGSGFNGTLTNGPTYSSTNGGSIVFAGASSTYASVGNIGVLPSTGTINYWMRSTDVANYRNPFSTHRIGGNVGFRWEQVTGGTFYVVAGNDAESFTSYNYTTSLAASTWYMVSVTWNTATSTIIGYLNATQVFNSTTHTQWATSTATNLALGSGLGNVADRYFTGNISNAQVYNRALSATEILQNFNATRARFGV